MKSKDATRLSTLAKVSVPKSYDVLADRLRDAILHEMEEGARLPTERELVDQTGLSRGSVREALRKLEVEGLIKPRLGRFGGNIVSRPGNDSMAHFVAQFVRGRRLSLRALQEARETIEPALARLAALHRTEEDLQRLREINEQLATPGTDSSEFAELNIQWHNAVGAASGNDLLEAFLFSISYGVVAATIDEEYDTEQTRAEAVRAHNKVIEAITERDGDAAFRRMERHVKATRERVKSHEDRELPIAPPERI
jgi:GntR family transcriptional regulator, transcriptional repressor for pyruvate dehydrogenase complex